MSGPRYCTGESRAVWPGKEPAQDDEDQDDEDNDNKTSIIVESKVVVGVGGDLVEGSQVVKCGF